MSWYSATDVSLTAQASRPWRYRGRVEQTKESPQEFPLPGLSFLERSLKDSLKYLKQKKEDILRRFEVSFFFFWPYYRRGLWWSGVLYRARAPQHLTWEQVLLLFNRSVIDQYADSHADALSEHPFRTKCSQEQEATANQDSGV